MRQWTTFINRLETGKKHAKVLHLEHVGQCIKSITLHSGSLHTLMSHLFSVMDNQFFSFHNYSICSPNNWDIKINLLQK